MNDLEVLARTLYGEARAFDEIDAAAIACVVLNRVEYRNWPGTAREVCLQPKQFSCWNETDPNRTRILLVERGHQWFDRCWEIAADALAGKIKDPTRSSTHYHTRAVHPSWSKGKTPVYETQGHIFFNAIDTPAPKDAADALNQERPLSETRTVKTGVVTLAAGALGALYESAGEVIQEATTAVVPLSTMFGDADVKAVAIVIMAAGIAYMLYARADDRKKGKR